MAKLFASEAACRAAEVGDNTVLADLFAREGYDRVTMRRMFGKTGVFCDGLMFGMVTNDTLYFRVDDRNRAAFEEAA